LIRPDAKRAIKAGLRQSFSQQNLQNQRRIKLSVGNDSKLDSALSQPIASRQYQLGAILKGDSGLLYSFDGYLRSDPGSVWRSLGIGYPGYQLIVKAFGYPPRPEDLLSLKNAAEDVSKQNRLPPSRVIALWIRRADQDLSEESYRTVMETKVAFAHRRKRFASSLELIIENEDGTYEFIPYMAA